jgi:hypothetical protein
MTKSMHTRISKKYNKHKIHTHKIHTHNTHIKHNNTHIKHNNTHIKHNNTHIKHNNTHIKHNNTKTYNTYINNKIGHQSGKFYSTTQIDYTKKEPKDKDILLTFLDNSYLLFKNKILKGKQLDKEIFTDLNDNCICKNILKNNINKYCKCNKMKKYASQGKSGASIHSMKCKINNLTQKTILKVLKINDYYIKLNQQTKKYIFLECDDFTIQTIINSYIYKELPMNSVNLISSGICKNKSSKYYGYNLMDEADLGSGAIFINNLLDGKYDTYLNISNADDKYKLVVNFLLQSVLIIGHLQSSSLEFFHGDYKPDNVFVKKTIKGEPQYFEFNVFGKIIKVKNMGFAVLIADFDKSSISVHSNKYNKKYRFIPPIKVKILLTPYVNNIIKKYGDIDPDITNEDINIKPIFISKLITHTKNPIISILRSAGIKLYRDLDLYTFFVRAFNIHKIKTFITTHKIDKTILSFMSDKFLNAIYNNKIVNNNNILNFNETVYIIVNTLNKLNEPLPRIFTPDYIKTLDLLNYKLFKI